MPSSSRQALPVYGWRLLAMGIVWNAVILSDRHVFGFRAFGYLTIVMCGCFAVFFLTAPMGMTPGKWLVRNQAFAYRWRLVFWWLALVLSFIFFFGAYDAIWKDGMGRRAPTGEETARVRFPTKSPIIAAPRRSKSQLPLAVTTSRTDRPTCR